MGRITALALMHVALCASVRAQPSGSFDLLTLWVPRATLRFAVSENWTGHPAGSYFNGTHTIRVTSITHDGDSSKNVYLLSDHVVGTTQRARNDKIDTVFIVDSMRVDSIVEYIGLNFRDARNRIAGWIIRDHADSSYFCRDSALGGFPKYYSYPAYYRYYDIKGEDSLDITADTLRMGSVMQCRDDAWTGTYLVDMRTGLRSYETMVWSWFQGSSTSTWSLEEANQVTELELDSCGIQSLTPFPNPVSTVAMFRFEIDAPKEVDIAILDNLGRQISVSPTKCVIPGEQTASFNCGALPNGMYLCAIKAGKRRLCARFNVLH